MAWGSEGTTILDARLDPSQNPMNLRLLAAMRQVGTIHPENNLATSRRRDREYRDHRCATSGYRISFQILRMFVPLFFLRLCIYIRPHQTICVPINIAKVFSSNSNNLGLTSWYTLCQGLPSPGASVRAKYLRTQVFQNPSPGAALVRRSQKQTCFAGLFVKRRSLLNSQKCFTKLVIVRQSYIV